MAALGRLQDATVTPLAPSDYVARVEDVKREVAPTLGNPSDRADVRNAIGAAVRYHAFAAFAGTVYESRGDLAAIGQDPVVIECGSLTDLVARDAKELGLNPSDPTVVGLLAATEGAPALRECAADEIDKAALRARAPR